VNILALAKRERHADTQSEAEALLAELADRDEARPFQLALASLAVGRKEQAVDYLSRAAYGGDVLALHLGIWPFLRELDGYAPFEQLKSEVSRGLVFS
jgi:hypothetical protein